MTKKNAHTIFSYKKDINRYQIPFAQGFLFSVPLLFPLVRHIYYACNSFNVFSTTVFLFWMVHNTTQLTQFTFCTSRRMELSKTNAYKFIIYHFFFSFTSCCYYQHGKLDIIIFQFYFLIVFFLGDNRKSPEHNDDRKKKYNLANTSQQQQNWLKLT